ncbi:gliding motility-associated C-terminal domain-containing protein [Aquimarina sp. SS2-1]|uniref:T9SS type B sorting domain-containing protein n=1 Tax=Aquimarina besae TaxID=3342247 RepID=UPI0036723427
MKTYKTKLLFILLIVFGSFGAAIAQCNQTQTISICDMETIDFDNDGNPDGIVNLYDEYTAITGLTIQNGVWSVDPRFTVALDPSTGNVATWALQRSTETQTINDYTFQLRNSDCGDDIALTINIILGPYSGVALPSFGTLNVNAEGCGLGGFNLFNTLVSDNAFPPPHLNGTWSYNGSSPNFVAIFESSLLVDIPYQPGLPLVDQEVFELTYTVPGIGPCDADAQTTVRVSMIRQVDSGASEGTDICEDDMLAGVYDQDINLRDDEYLRNEDIEGIWLPDEDPTGQISNEQDSIINLRAVYNDLIDNGNNLRYGCETFNFYYKVNQRSAVCRSDSTAVSFTFYEQLRPFSQEDAPFQICASEPGGVNLFDLLTFTTENNTEFIYTNENYVNWRLVSGSSNLGLIDQGSIDFSHEGFVVTNGATPGTYVFEYGVSPKINCKEPPEVCNPFITLVNPNHCEHPCEVETALVTVEIFPFDYAGENTSGLSFCETDITIDLRSQLQSNGAPIATTGTWTDADGGSIDNLFTIPPITDSQIFTFTYTTNTINGCTDEAVLSFTVFEEANAGNGTSITLCSDNLTLTLFDLLEGNPDTTGIWTGPFGYTSPDHLGIFDASDIMLPILGPGDYIYTVEGNDGCSGMDQATVTINIVDPVQIGNDRSDSFCEIDGRVNLFTILDNDTPRTGSFQDIENTGALTPEGVVEFDLLPNPDNEINKIYNFRYVIPNTAPCDESSLNVEVQIIDLPEPNVPDQEFCILDAKRLDDIEVDVLNYNWYPTLESDMPIIDNPLLFDNQVFYIATVDADNCESERVTVNINILNMGERFSNGDLCTLDFQDGVSPDGNNQNDTFDLFIEGEFNIPVAFPDFDLKIYNRYGAAVYEGNLNTEPFRGESNVSLRLGDDLPSGTYFYIFTPNFENNFPIQGSFYLSR